MMKLIQNKAGSFFKNHTGFLLILFLFLGAILRIISIDKNSYYFDEIFSIYNTDLNFGDFYFSPTRSLITLQVLPLYYMVLNLWVNLFSSAEFVTRLLSAIFGVTNIFMTYKVGNELFNKYVGLFASFINTISFMQIYYSQEIRYYALLELLTLVSYFYFIKYLKNKNKTHLLVCCLVNILACYCHTFGIFTMMAQVIFMMWAGIRNKKIDKPFWFYTAMTGLLIIVGWLPIFGNLYTRGNTNLLPGWMKAPSPADLVRTLFVYIFPPRFNSSISSVAPLYIGAGLFFLAIAFYYLYRSRKSITKKDVTSTYVDSWMQKKDELILSCLWLITPILTPFILSFIVMPMYQDRYTIGATPAFYFLIAYFLYITRKYLPAYTFVAAALIIIIPRLFFFYTNPVKEQWRDGASLIDTMSTQNDIIVFAHDTDGWRQKCLQWYLKTPLATCNLDDNMVDKNNAVSQLNQCVKGYERYWFVVRGEEVNKEEYKKEILNQGEFQLSKEYPFFGITLYLVDHPTAK